MARTHARRFPAVVVCLLLLLLATPACSRRETLVQTGDRLGILHLGNRDEPRDLDPQVVFFNTDANISRALFEGLTVSDPQTLLPRPGVAERWDVSADGLVYTFHLRPNARWSNGDPVTARDFLFSFRRILSPGLGAEAADYFYDVRNAEAFNKGTLTDFAQVGFRAPDDRTLEITLAHPTPYLLSLLYHNTWLPVHPPTIEKFGRIDQRATGWTRPGNLIGNGPFILADWQVNKEVVVRKNPTHWDAAAVRLNEIRFYPIADADAEERAFRGGQLHVTYSLPVSKLDAYRQSNPDLLHVAPGGVVCFFTVNVTRPPLDDLRVRRALSLAVDRGSLVKNVLRAGEVAATHFIPPGTGADYAPLADRKLREFDPVEARRLLAEAGFPGGKGLPAIELLAPGGSKNRSILEAIQAMWEKELGFRAAIRTEEAKVFQDSRNRLNYGVALLNLSADYDDPYSYLFYWKADGPNNRTGWASAAYDARLDAAARSLDRGARFAEFQQAEALLLDELPVVPLYFGARPTLRQPSVQGWFDNPLDIHEYRAVFLQPR